ncbi:hypothetical protein NFI96_005114 [Prochilodus magdalenae]|nr:hypothetical protein NFI96_005114 [Prochilodus magdalenae]
MRRGVPRVLVVLTDGRSQDDVNKISKEMQLEGYIIFAIGFADADYGELVNIASKPSERHVFFVDDLEPLCVLFCDAAGNTLGELDVGVLGSDGDARLPDDGRMCWFLVEKQNSNVQGVSQWSLGLSNSFPCYEAYTKDAAPVTAHRGTSLSSQPTRDVPCPHSPPGCHL